MPPPSRNGDDPRGWAKYNPLSRILFWYDWFMNHGHIIIKLYNTVVG